MALRNSSDSWGWAARLLHWGMAGLLLFLLGLGFYMANFEPDIYQQFAWTQIHKSWGFVAFTLALIRVVWRFANPTPALPGGMTAPQRLAAHGAHIALYVCLFVMPISGWLMASASPLQDTYGIKNLVFGLFELPDPFVPGTEQLDNLLGAIHFYTGLTLSAIVGVHIAAALKHAIVEKDGVLRRMIFG